MAVLEDLIRAIELWLRIAKEQVPLIDPNLDPVLLVPGIGGSILEAVDQAGNKERVWVRILATDHECREKLWAKFDAATAILKLDHVLLGSLPCIICLRCLKDTCIPEDALLKDPRRLYAPGRIYHIVERKSFSILLAMGARLRSPSTQEELAGGVSASRLAGSQRRSEKPGGQLEAS
ncbi:hypothetical protein QYE76_037399 [Lolium multiflorum]|uniref:Uncharacterized protein n=1 Tax=Lolium multiflorum TaxID=4521 RepID=A0AAD8QH03_LOLMU|nr:hypothetical protein QYE76_037399 [Lolium multiflorum]